MNRPLLVFLAMAVSVFPVWGQNSAVHQHSQPDLIDVSTHPELIPDFTAYRLYFIAISENPAPLPFESRRQLAHLKRAGLKGTDIQATIKLLASFKSEYGLMVEQDNASPDVANNSSDGLPLFIKKRDALVQATRDALKAALTGWDGQF